MRFKIHIEKELINQDYCYASDWLSSYECAYNVYENSDKNQKIIWFGDFVPPEDYKSKDEYINDLFLKFESTKLIFVGGCFYMLRVLKHECKIEVFSNFLNIMPLYFSESSDNIIITSDINLIYTTAKECRISKRFIIEKLLFNYAFKNETIFENVKSVNGNHYLEIENGRLKEQRLFSIENLYTDELLSDKQATSLLMELFNLRLKKYIPDKHFYLSFTGGFDGRTILGGVKQWTDNFITYSFGTSDSEDITNPLEVSKPINVKYKPYYLDTDDYLSNSFNCGLSFVERTGGMTNFARAHYAYAISDISNETKYILTGNFGSEMFRAAHLQGVVFSPLLIYLFLKRNVKEFLETYEFPELRWISDNIYKNTLNDIRDELNETGYWCDDTYALNRKFYVYQMENMFRNYYGTEISYQSDFVYNRYPFLDFEFVKLLFRTSYAGCYRRFFDHNPLRRYKGQLFYVNYLKKYSPDIYNLPTGKGYKPSDLFGMKGKAKLLLNFINKKKKSAKENNDPYGVSGALEFNRDSLKKISWDRKYFNISDMNLSGFPGRNCFINYWSLNWLINKYMNNM